MLGIFNGRRLGEADNAVLGGDIGRGGGKADRAQNRGHVDNGAAARGQDGRNLVAHAVEHAGQIGGDDLVPAVERIVARRRGGAGNAGIVDGQVQPPEVALGGSHHGLDFKGIADIDGKAPGLSALRHDGVGNGLGTALVQIGNQDLGSRGSKQLGDRGANAGRAAGNDGNLVLEIESHGKSPWGNAGSGETGQPDRLVAIHSPPKTTPADPGS